jgi:hypothetical protein
MDEQPQEEIPAEAQGEEMNEAVRMKRNWLVTMSKLAHYMALYYALEFQSTEGLLFRRKKRQSDYFRDKAEQLEEKHR